MLKEKIDFNNDGVDLHLGGLGGVLENWEDVAPVLELDGIAIGDIQADHPLSRGERRSVYIGYSIRSVIGCIIIAIVVAGP